MQFHRLSHSTRISIIRTRTVTFRTANWSFEKIPLKRYFCFFDNELNDARLCIIERYAVEELRILLKIDM